VPHGGLFFVMIAADRSPTATVVGRQAKSMLGIAAGFSVLINLLMLTSPLYMIQVFDRVLASGRTETLLMLTLIAGVAVLVLGLLEAVRGRLLAGTGIWIEQQLAPLVIGAGLAQAPQGRATAPQALRDLATLRGFLSGGAILGLLDAPWVGFFILVLALLHPWLGVVALVAAVVLFAVALLNEVTTRTPLRESSAAAANGNRGVDVALRHGETVEAMGMTRRLLRGWSGFAATAAARQLVASNRSADLLSAARAFRLFVQILILALGAYLVLRRQLTPGGMVAGSIILGRALAPIEQGIGGWRSFIWARDAWHRVRVSLEGGAGEVEPMPLPEPEGVVSCQEVWLVPPGGVDPVLGAVQFSLAPGELVAIIGPSGAGKSALCNVLVGAWAPVRGRACLDGVDIRKWNLEQRARFVGYLPQVAGLLEGTIKENIARMSDEADPAAVVEAARAAGAHDFILSLPDAYDTRVGEGGVSLSSGQRQRIALARAVYGRPKFIVLDDPHAGLDEAGEAHLRNLIEAARRWGATVVVVAAQRPTVMAADKLMILHKGRIQAFGPRDEVLSEIRCIQSRSAAARAPAVPVLQVAPPSSGTEDARRAS